ncbi:MAG: exodeoxyribonuclease VII large subunit, partial [Eubacteriales bacterium]
RSIYQSIIPVISAVGHETDFTIADFVADRRAPTPSAAAEIVVPDCMEIQKHLTNLTKRLVTGIRNNVTILRERVVRAGESQFLKRPKDDLYRKMQDVDYLTRRLGQSMIVQFNGKKTAFAIQMSRLNDLSPIATLNRGYSICRDIQGNVIKQVKMTSPGKSIEILMADGSVDCIVEKIKEGAYGWEEK